MTESIQGPADQGPVDGPTASWRRFTVIAVGTAVLTAVAWLGIATWAWGAGMGADGQLLPGTTIAGTSVGELGPDEAHDTVRTAVDRRLEGSVTVTHGERSWEVTAASLEGEADVDTAIAGAVEATRTADYLDLVGYRWLGSHSDLDIPVPIEVPEPAAEAFVDDLADEVDREPVDARVELADGELQLVADEPGARVDRAAATAALLAAFDQGATEVTLPVDDATARVTADAVSAVLPDVQQAMDRTLDSPVTLEHGEEAWEVTARQLQGRVDVQRAVADAVDAHDGAGVQPSSEGTTDAATAVDLTVEDTAAAAFVDGLAEDIDREPVDAALEATGDGPEVIASREGARVDREATTSALLAALGQGPGTVTLPVETLEPGTRTDEAAAVLPEVDEAIDRGLDQTVTFSHEDRTWSTTPRELRATVDVGPVAQAALAGGDTAAAVAPSAPQEALDSVVDAIADEVDLAAIDGELSTEGGEVELVAGRPGLAVDRPEARARLAAAIGGGPTQLTVPTVTVQPEQGNLSDVLVLRQSDRELDHYVDGEVARTWPVAVGTGGSPTPTGTFTVGAKRFEPTWVNPAPDRWGAEMPDRIGPGPDNPLGLRALNWHRPGGGDTLIRFHGTPNEASIGQASSNGCVRMFNDDVIELYDRVASGTTIVSLA